MNYPAPNFAWYSDESKRLALPHVRCPFANMHVCPRYFDSRALLGSAGSTPISPELDKQLEARWKTHPLRPQTPEDSPSLIGNGEKIFGFHNFCPEVIADKFGLFATYLGKYADELDLDLAHRRLGEEGASADDPRWNWSGVEAQHYSGCPLHAPLSHGWPKSAIEDVSRKIPSTSNNSTRYDVFISHASEDKDCFVRDLAAELTRLGLTVWYDETTLELGDSLRQKIDEGLANSQYGAVVLSHHFFAKNWPQAELDGLFAREMEGRKVILPVWHEITKEDVLKYSPLLAGKLAVVSAKGVTAVAKDIFKVARPNQPEPTQGEGIAVQPIIKAPDGFYSALLQKIVDLCMLKQWNEVRSDLNNSLPECSEKFDENVSELKDYIGRAVWPKKFPEMECAAKNVSRSVSLLIDTLQLHSTSEHGKFRGRYFYKDMGHNPNYDRDLELFNRWMKDYKKWFGQYIRSLNWFSDVVREQLDPNFFKEEGYFTERFGEAALHYTQLEKDYLLNPHKKETERGFYKTVLKLVDYNEQQRKKKSQCPTE